MIWYILFCTLAMIVLGIVLDAMDVRPVVNWTGGFLCGSLFMYGLLTQYGELIY